MSTLPTGTITFLFTDLQGSTQLWENHPEAMRVDLARHDALLRAAITENGGHVFKTVGDAFCAAFPTAQGAVRAALAAQRALHAEPWTVGTPGLRARVALHTGEAQERDGDYFGPALNRVARLRDAAHGGQTLLSQATEQLVRDALPADARLGDLGPHRLPDLSRPEQVFQLHHPTLPGDFPPLRSLDRFPNNLPQRLDSFIGREGDLAHVKRLLTSARLLTLTGVGGAGKTRLAQQAAAESLEQYPQGVWLVALEALTDPALIPQEVAAVVGVRENPGRLLVGTLCEALRAQHLLLILDNCEHLIADCARLAQSLLQACPRLQILATSREPLAINGEATYPVPTLPLDPARSNAPEEPSDAVRLFLDRAALSLPSFTLTAQNGSAVARICRQLDGIPLAIELAAPRVKMLTPEQISQRLDQRFRLLTGGSRTALPRQQTMQAAIQWSHDLLSEPERLLFHRLSVFAGGWTLEAAEQVCSGDGLDEWDVMERLSSLVAKSLVQSDAEEGGTHRYRMLETLRQYSWEQMLASPGFEAVRDRHQSWFLSLAERAEPELRGSEQGVWLDRLEMEHDNLRAALAWAAPEARLRLTAALQRFWLMRGYLTEGRQWLSEALTAALAAAPLFRARAQSALGVLAWAQADYDESRRLHEQSLRLSRELGERHEIANALKNLGIVSDYHKNYDDARRFYEESLAIYRNLEDTPNTASVLLNLGAHHSDRGQLAEAKTYLKEALTVRRALDDHTGIAMALFNLGRVAYKEQRWHEALALFLESLEIRRGLADRRGMAASLYHVACAAHALGDNERAACLMGAAEGMLEALNAFSLSAYDESHAQVTAGIERAIGAETDAQMRRKGRHLPLVHVMELARTTDTQKETHTCTMETGG